MRDRWVGKPVVCALAAGVLASALLGAQESSRPPRFQGGVELIQLTVSVLDNQRRPVRGLTAADFTVSDNGVAKPLRAFTAVDVPGKQSPSPGAAAWVKDVAPDVATNQVGEEPGRLVVILMDRSIPHEAPVVTARKIAISIVDSMGPNDLAALISTSGGDPQNFTSDRARLIKAINQRDWATDSDENPWDLEESLSDGRCLCGECVLDTVTHVAEAVRGASSRSRTLFFIGKGVIMQAPPRAPKADPGCDRIARNARVKMLDAVALSNLTVHSIDPSGLYSIGPQTRASTPNLPPMPEGQASRIRREMQQAETNKMLASQGTLRVLPDLTGGRAIFNRNDPDEVVPEVFRESESYYLIGFEAAADGGANRPRSIEVKVNRRGVKVATQRQYVAPGTSEADVRPSLRGLLPDAAPPLRLALAAFAKADGPNADLGIVADVSNFIGRSSSASSFDVSVTVVDQLGRPVSSAREAFTVTGSAAPTTDAPIELRTHVEVPPGDLELRVAVSDTKSGSSASVFSQLVVPEFADQRLSLSHLAIDTSPADYGSVPFVSVAPTSVRTFARTSGPSKFFVQVYQGVGRTDRLIPVSLHTQITDAFDRVARDTTRTIDEEAFERRRYDFRSDIPVETLAPGEYLLSVTAAAGSQSANRSMRFAVK